MIAITNTLDCLTHHKDLKIQVSDWNSSQIPIPIFCFDFLDDSQAEERVENDYQDEYYDGEDDFPSGTNRLVMAASSDISPVSSMHSWSQLVSSSSSSVHRKEQDFLLKTLIVYSHLFFFSLVFWWWRFYRRWRRCRIFRPTKETFNAASIEWTETQTSSVKWEISRNKLSRWISSRSKPYTFSFSFGCSIKRCFELQCEQEAKTK